MSHAPLDILRQMHTEISRIVSPIYLVGGCVRDACMGIDPHDFDVATPLLPQEVESLITAAKRRAYTVGKRFGTIGFKVNGNLVEITTFRDESYLLYNRQPEVSFVKDLSVDLGRRDFTINALAYDGSIIDPFNGQHDLQHKILRCVGDPSQRFFDDPLRLLRGVRFASQFDLHIESHTHQEMVNQAPHILHVAIERIIVELDNLLSLPSLNAVVQGLTLLHDTRILPHLIPELFSCDSHIYATEYEILCQQINRGISTADSNEVHPLMHAQRTQADPLCNQRWFALLLLVHRHTTPNLYHLNSTHCQENAWGCIMLKRVIERYAKALRFSNKRLDALHAYADAYVERTHRTSHP